MHKLNEVCQKGDNKKIISSLIELRKLSKMNEIDTNTFESLVNLIKIPNTKVINYTLSILANCCLNNNYRYMFKEMGGIPHLVLVLKTIDNDSIICRACRLIGNLALSRDLAKDLGVHNAGETLLQLLEKYENLSLDTIMMAFRALKKLWTALEKIKIMPDNTLPTFYKCLNADDEQLVCLTLETLLLLTQLKSDEKSKQFKVNKPLFLKLIELSKREKLNCLSISCLSNIICYQCTHIWSYLEGSNIAEIFIDYIQRVDNVDGVVLRALQKLCTEGAIRNKVKVAGLLPRLVDICNETNVRKILSVLYQFQYDVASVMICSQHPRFTSILINHVLLPGAIPLLTVLSRLDPPIKELVLNESLNVLINTRECKGILKNMTRTTQFLKPIILSGKVWEIEKAGCSLEDLGSTSHSEGLIIHLLSSGEKKCREDVSLAIPFLVKPRQFEVLYKLLVHYQAIKTILDLFQESPLEERILASIIRLIKIFRCNYHHSESFFQDLVKYDNEFCLHLKDVNISSGLVEDQSATQVASGLDSEVALVTFELDNGTCVDLDKNLLCKNSPVLDSMLNGHFMEAGQDKVKLPWCSKEALIHIEKLLKGEIESSEINLELYLELLSLTDRLLLMNLNNVLTDNLKIDEASCPIIYQWYRQAGQTKNNSLVRQKTYEFLFSSSEYLASTLRNEYCRVPLINEISSYLNNSLVDLL